MTAIVSVKVPEPQFKGQTKGELGNSEVTGIVSRACGEVLQYYLEENKHEVKRIIDKVIWQQQQDMLLEKPEKWFSVKTF